MVKVIKKSEVKCPICKQISTRDTIFGFCKNFGMIEVLTLLRDKREKYLNMNKIVFGGTVTFKSLNEISYQIREEALKASISKLKEQVSKLNSEVLELTLKAGTAEIVRDQANWVLKRTGDVLVNIFKTVEPDASVLNRESKLHVERADSNKFTLTFRVDGFQDKDQKKDESPLNRFLSAKFNKSNSEQQKGEENVGNSS